MMRPKEALGFYEYFVRKRSLLRKFFEAREARMFKRALRNISDGENPSGWVLAQPSSADRDITLDPFAENDFIRWETDLYYFPNERVRKEWLDYHWEEFRLTRLTGETMLGRPILQVTGTNR
jgi:hypothetical protein